jgi:hypothetical protein
VHQIAHRVGRYLERQGWLERDAENDYLALDTADDDPLSVLQGHSITYRIALVPKPRVNLTRYHGVFAPNSARW